MFGLGAKKKILVVDDEVDVLSIVKTRLEINNYEVFTASNGDDGFNAAVAQKPDLILLDVVMPVKTGFEVCQQLKDNSETANIPVIFLTAKGRESDMMEGARLGAVNYVIKPYDYKDLLAKIEKALKK